MSFRGSLSGYPTVIIEGRRTAQEVRDFCGPAATAYAKGESSPYAEGLMFTPQAGSADPDEAIISLEEIKKSLAG